MKTAAGMAAVALVCAAIAFSGIFGLLAEALGAGTTDTTDTTTGTGPPITTTYDQCLTEVLDGEVICLVGAGDRVDLALIGEPSRTACDRLANRGDEPKVCVVTDGPDRGATFPIADATDNPAERP